MGRRFSKRRSSYIQLAPATVLRTVRPALWPICSDLIRDGQWPESARGWPARVAPYCNDRKFGNYCYTVCIPPNTDKRLFLFPTLAAFHYLLCMTTIQTHRYTVRDHPHTMRKTSKDCYAAAAALSDMLGSSIPKSSRLSLVIPISIHLSQIIPVCRIER